MSEEIQVPEWVKDDSSLVRFMLRLWRKEGPDMAMAAVRNGLHVPTYVLSWLLRNEPNLPEDIRDHIAGRLDGSIRMKGRPTTALDDGWAPWATPEQNTERVRVMVAAFAVRDRELALKAKGVPNAYRLALEEVAAKFEDVGISPSRLDKYLYPRSENIPP
jgi:hypothetical protein